MACSRSGSTARMKSWRCKEIRMTSASRWVVALSAFLAVFLVGVAGQAPAPQGPPPAGGPPGFPFALPPGGLEAMAADRPLVKQFDKDGNGRLDLAERAAARQWMATQPLTGIPAMMDFMSRGIPGGRAGMAKMMGGRGPVPS